MKPFINRKSLQLVIKLLIQINELPKKVIYVCQRKLSSSSKISGQYFEKRNFWNLEQNCLKKKQETTEELNQGIEAVKLKL